MSDQPPREHALTPDEERIWKTVKAERNTREDWEDLNRTMVGYKRRYIARHTRRSEAAGQAVNPIQHGVNCPKVPHAGAGYLHDAAADGPYDVDGVRYCGRCHVWLESWWPK